MRRALLTRAAVANGCAVLCCTLMPMLMLNRLKQRMVYSRRRCCDDGGREEVDAQESALNTYARKK